MLAATPKPAPIYASRARARVLYYNMESESLPAFFAVPKIYFHLILLALTDIRDNLSRIFRDKGGGMQILTRETGYGIMRDCFRTWCLEILQDSSE